MGRNYQQFFAILYIYLLSISLTIAARVIVTAEDPYRTESTSKFLAYAVEDFDKATQTVHQSYDSSFTSLGFESKLRGRYNDGALFNGTYSNLNVKPNDLMGGVGVDFGGYNLCTSDCVLTVKSARDYRTNYFGFHGETLTVEDRMEFYLATEMIFELKMEDLIAHLENVIYKHKEWQYQVNPNLQYEAESKEAGELFGFFNVYFEDATFDSIKFRAGADYASLSTDIHTLGVYLERSGEEVPVSTAYIQPSQTVLPNIPSQRPKIPRARVRVKVEPPRSSTTLAAVDWFACENFKNITAGLLPHAFKSDRIGGTYSAPFRIITNRSTKQTYFTTPDSLLNLTITKGREPNMFGLFLNPINPYGILEFFLKGDKIFQLYLADIFEFIQDKPEYLGHPKYPEMLGAIFVYVSVLFDTIVYDAVRFRTWTNLGGDFTSTGHFIGKYYYHDSFGEFVWPLRTMLKIRRRAQASATEEEPATSSAPQPSSSEPQSKERHLSAFEAAQPTKSFLAKTG